MIPSPTEQLSNWCQETVAFYLSMFRHEAAGLHSLQALLNSDTDLANRKTLPGHLTASGVVFDSTHRKVLVVHHRGLNCWLQPGGHMEAGELPIETARREILEEVGIGDVRLLSPIEDRVMPIHIDSHLIPANPRKEELAHTHHDFRFAFAGDSTQPLRFDANEVAGAAWVNFDDVRLDESLIVALRKLSTCQLFPID